MSAINICQGCLSADRRLGPIGKHAKLYQALLLTKLSTIVKKQWLLCWECHKILDNVSSFCLRITEAQKLLHNASLAQYNSLSNLTSTTNLDNYETILHVDIKDKKPIEFDVERVKNEKIEESDVDVTSVVEPKDIKTNEIAEMKLYDKLEIEIVKNENDDTDFDDTEMGDSEMTADMEMTDNKDVKKELDEPLISLDTLEQMSHIVVQKTRKKRGVLKKKYRTIIMEDIPDKRKLYDKVNIDHKALQEWLEKKKKSRKRKQFQCERCFSGFATKKYYDRHLAVRHAKRLGSYECEICGFRFAEKRKLSYHVSCHYVQFVCKLCGTHTCTRNQMYLHFTHGPHGKQWECKKCGLRFDCRRRREFFEHYRTMHERHICDYCGRNYFKKHSLVAHIHKHHTIHRCDICNVTYGTLDSYSRHRKAKHVVDVSEENYCVECNMQFLNNVAYTTHIKRSSKHRATPAIPCPECGKVYTKNCSMKNHYNLVHLKKSDNHCAICDTYYLTGYRLRYHQKYFHEKAPKPKNKLCKYCGKGFNNNRILDNHVRTHTGERPFACALCSAAFTQKQSLTAHIRAAHK